MIDVMDSHAEDQELKSQAQRLMKLIPPSEHTKDMASQAEWDYVILLQLWEANKRNYTIPTDLWERLKRTCPGYFDGNILRTTEARTRELVAA